MLDIKRIKENPAYAKERLATRQKDYSAEIDRLLERPELPLHSGREIERSRFPSGIGTIQMFLQKRLRIYAC